MPPSSLARVAGAGVGSKGGRGGGRPLGEECHHAALQRAQLHACAPREGICMHKGTLPSGLKPMTGAMGRSRAAYARPASREMCRASQRLTVD
jgi:hypothetical protein